jgi:hypothetical protein
MARTKNTANAGAINVPAPISHATESTENKTIIPASNVLRKQVSQSLLSCLPDAIHLESQANVSKGGKYVPHGFRIAELPSYEDLWAWAYIYFRASEGPPRMDILSYNKKETMEYRANTINIRTQYDALDFDDELLACTHAEETEVLALYYILLKVESQPNKKWFLLKFKNNEESSDVIEGLCERLALENEAEEKEGDEIDGGESVLKIMGIGKGEIDTRGRAIVKERMEARDNDKEVSLDEYLGKAIELGHVYQASLWKYRQLAKASDRHRAKASMTRLKDQFLAKKTAI